MNITELIISIDRAIYDIEYIRNKMCDIELNNMMQASYALGELHSYLCHLNESVKESFE